MYDRQLNIPNGYGNNNSSNVEEVKEVKELIPLTDNTMYKNYNGIL